MKEAVRVLIIEDSEDDASLLVEQIKQAGIRIEFKIISSKEDFLESLAQEEWDIILSDEKMPGFSGSEALKILKESGLDIPFVLVSGIIPANIGADVMYQGAKDFIKKDDISRLLPIIQRELDQKQIRDEREILLENGESFLLDSKIIIAYMKGGKISKRVETIMILIDKETINGFISPIAFLNIYKYYRETSGELVARKRADLLRRTNIQIIQINQEMLQPIMDWIDLDLSLEDAINVAISKVTGAKLVTTNLDRFKDKNIQVLDIERPIVTKSTPENIPGET